MGGDDCERAGPLQRTHVVDDVGAGVEGGAYDLGPARVHRDRHAQREGLAQHRQHARQFLVDAGLCRARARRFATDVQDVSALGQQALAMRDRAGGIGMTSAVRERIRSDVDDAHHLRTAQVDREAGGLPEPGRRMQLLGASIQTHGAQ